MKKTTIKPLGENILVQPQKSEKKTDSGIFLPETSSEARPSMGEVIAIGESDKIKVKVGQTVVYARYGGSEIKLSGEEYLIVKNEDVLAVLE